MMNIKGIIIIIAILIVVISFLCNAYSDKWVLYSHLIIAVIIIFSQNVISGGLYNKIIDDELDKLMKNDVDKMNMTKFKDLLQTGVVNIDDVNNGKNQEDDSRTPLISRIIIKAKKAQLDDDLVLLYINTLVDYLQQLQSAIEWNKPAEIDINNQDSFLILTPFQLAILNNYNKVADFILKKIETNGTIPNSELNISYYSKPDRTQVYQYNILELSIIKSSSDIIGYVIDKLPANNTILSNQVGFGQSNNKITPLFQLCMKATNNNSPYNKCIFKLLKKTDVTPDMLSDIINKESIYILNGFTITNYPIHHIIEKSNTDLLNMFLNIDKVDYSIIYKKFTENNQLVIDRPLLHTIVLNMNTIINSTNYALTNKTFKEVLIDKVNNFNVQEEKNQNTALHLLLFKYSEVELSNDSNKANTLNALFNNIKYLLSQEKTRLNGQSSQLLNITNDKGKSPLFYIYNGKGLAGKPEFMELANLYKN